MARDNRHRKKEHFTNTKLSHAMTSTFLGWERLAMAVARRQWKWNFARVSLIYLFESSLSTPRYLRINSVGICESVRASAVKFCDKLKSVSKVKITTKFWAIYEHM